jgi:hypothetical protein
MLGCTDAPPQAFVATTGDCDDYRKTVYPGAKELCNMIDDNCDGAIDENAVPVELWPDADGDGYYDARTEKVGTPKIGCAGLKGWAAEPGDCQPMNKLVSPAWRRRATTSTTIAMVMPTSACVRRAAKVGVGAKLRVVTCSTARRASR